MPRHVLLPSAKTDLGATFRYCARAWRDREAARLFVHALRDHSKKLAGLPGTLGRLRPELGPDLRSAPFRGYLFIFRYHGDAFQVVRIIQGSRDIPAQFDPDPS